MALGIYTPNRKPIYSPNLLPATSVFTDAVDINILVGPSGSSVDFDFNTGFVKPDASIKAYNTSNSTGLLFNLDTALTTVVTKTGVYYLSLELKHNMPLSDMYADKLIVYVRVNGVQVYEMECILNVESTNEQLHYPNVWGTYGQKFTLTAGNSIDFQFRLVTNTSKPLGTSLMWMDAIKLEFDDKALNLPSIYSLPLILTL